MEDDTGTTNERASLLKRNHSRVYANPTERERESRWAEPVDRASICMVRVPQLCITKVEKMFRYSLTEKTEQKSNLCKVEMEEVTIAEVLCRFCALGVDTSIN